MLKSLPAKKSTPDDIFSTLEAYKAKDTPWRDGRTWAYLYYPGPEIEKVIKQAYMMYLSENGLDPTVFPSLLRLENEVVSMATQHLKGDTETVGNFTSGGTESIILAVKAARDWNRDHRPEITEPEMILPVTAHAAFYKAAKYLGVKAIPVEVDETTWKAEPAKIEEAITAQTILLVGSAVSYAHGVVDPIEEIGQLALNNNLFFHVDACMGGFLLPYFRRLGRDIPRFEFDVPGVTSMSMDLHKYAFAAKGASVILYKSKTLRKYQMFACAEWTGYTMVNPTVQSSKTGGPLAAAWAVLHAVGDDGYLNFAGQILDATDRIRQWINDHEALELLGKPEMNLIAFTSTTIDVFEVIDLMKERNWYIQPQLGYGASQENIHLSINPVSVPWVGEFLNDLGACVEQASVTAGSSSDGDQDGLSGIVGMLESADLDDTMLAQLLASAGVKDGQLPDKMADINHLMNALPPKLKEQVLLAFMNELFTADIAPETVGT